MIVILLAIVIGTPTLFFGATKVFCWHSLTRHKTTVHEYHLVRRQVSFSDVNFFLQHILKLPLTQDLQDWAYSGLQVAGFAGGLLSCSCVSNEALLA